MGILYEPVAVRRIDTAYLTKRPINAVFIVIRRNPVDRLYIKAKFAFFAVKTDAQTLQTGEGQDKADQTGGNVVGEGSNIFMLTVVDKDGTESISSCKPALAVTAKRIGASGYFDSALRLPAFSENSNDLSLI